MSDENQANEELVNLNKLLHDIARTATLRKSLTTAEEAEFTASAYSMNYASCSPRVRDMASRYMLIGAIAASSVAMLASLTREIIRIRDDNDTQAEQEPKRIELLCDDLDHEAIMHAIGVRLKLMGLPDAECGNEEGRIVAEICRAWKEMLFREEVRAEPFVDEQ